MNTLRHDYQWQGFLEESKRYAGHPDYWGEETKAKATPIEIRHAKIEFWKHYPKAMVLFYAYRIKDFVQFHWNLHRKLFKKP